MKIKQINKTKQLWIAIGLSALAILTLVIVGYVYLNNNSHDNNSQPSGGYYNPSTVNPDSNVPKSNSKTGQASSGITSSRDQSKNSTSTLDPNITPTTPLGMFVSNHHPNLSGTPAPNTETSTCTTTPGAQCQIRFTQNGATKSLPSQQTDGSGNTSWSWKIQDIGITEGTWKISAVAINGNLTSTTNDQMNLEVSK